MNIRVRAKTFAASAVSLSLLLIVSSGTLAQETADPDLSMSEHEITSPEDLPFSVSEPPNPPHWSFEIKGGDFEPELDDWQRFFGDDTSSELGVAVAYKLTRWLEVGLEADYIRDNGVGQLPLNNTTGGSVTYNLFPAHVYVLVRGIFHENQRFVPYVGGGFTRAFYREEIRNQATRRGDTDGEHVRAGLQILLDWIDQDGATSISSELGVNNTYLTLEVQKLSAELDGVELGGESAMIGLLFEF